MTQKFTRPALICNVQSGSYDEAMRARMEQFCRDRGAPFVAIHSLPDGDIPTRAALEGDGVDLLMVWTGDGTINSAARLADGWDGALLTLPGGTLNLLSKQLNGDRSVEEILASAFEPSVRRARIPIIRSPADEAFITVIAGPATGWAEVRETMRQDGIIEASRSAPEALDVMLNAPGVRVAGGETDYSAVILTPTSAGIRADGILTANGGDVLRHALAWLGGDFRDGPSEELAVAQEIMLESDSRISLEYDGELGTISSPARFTLAQSGVDFVITA